MENESTPKNYEGILSALLDKRKKSPNDEAGLYSEANKLVDKYVKKDRNRWLALKSEVMETDYTDNENSVINNGISIFGILLTYAGLLIGTMDITIKLAVLSISLLGVLLVYIGWMKSTKIPVNKIEKDKCRNYILVALEENEPKEN